MALLHRFQNKPLTENQQEAKLALG